MVYPPSEPNLMLYHQEKNRMLYIGVSFRRLSHAAMNYLFCQPNVSLKSLVDPTMVNLSNVPLVEV